MCIQLYLTFCKQCTKYRVHVFVELKNFFNNILTLHLNIIYSIDNNAFSVYIKIVCL